MKAGRRNKRGQAMVEAIIVLPILIILIWGVYRVHSVSFLGARAEMAARHAAWMGSVNENEGASMLESTFNSTDANAAGRDLFFNHESGMTDSLATFSINVEAKGMWVIDPLETAADDGDFNILDCLNMGGIAIDLLSNILSALPIFRPFTRNSWSEIKFSVDSYGFDKTDDIRATAYFANRWDSLYFKSIWDLLNVHFGETVSGITDAISDAEDAISQAEEDMEDAMEETDGEFPEGTPYTYDDFEEFLEGWHSFFKFW